MGNARRYVGLGTENFLNSIINGNLKMLFPNAQAYLSYKSDCRGPINTVTASNEQRNLSLETVEIEIRSVKFRN